MGQVEVSRAAAIAVAAILSVLLLAGIWWRTGRADVRRPSGPQQVSLEQKLRAEEQDGVTRAQQGKVDVARPRDQQFQPESD